MILSLMLILPLLSARLESLQVAFETYCQSPSRTSCASNSLTACNSDTAVTGVLLVVPLDAVHDGFLSSVTRLEHRFALLCGLSLSLMLIIVEVVSPVSS
jgi:hypothetical protein